MLGGLAQAGLVAGPAALLVLAPFFGAATHGRLDAEPTRRRERPIEAGARWLVRVGRRATRLEGSRAGRCALRRRRGAGCPFLVAPRIFARLRRKLGTARRGPL